MIDLPKQKRVVIYIPEKDYITLRAKLITMGRTVSEWAREVIKDFLRKN